MALTIKREKRKFNGSDLVILLLLVLGIAAVIFVRNHLMTATSATAQEDVCTIEYTLEFKKISNTVTLGIREGDSVRDPDNKQNMGTVVSVQTQAYSELVYQEDDGGVAMAENPDYSNLLITVRATASRRESGYYVNGTRLLVGKENHIWSRGFAGTGYCISIWETD